MDKRQELPNVTIQIMPFRLGGHGADGGAFSILRFDEPDLPDADAADEFRELLLR